MPVVEGVLVFDVIKLPVVVLHALTVQDFIEGYNLCLDLVRDDWRLEPGAARCIHQALESFLDGERVVRRAFPAQ